MPGEFLSLYSRTACHRHTTPVISFPTRGLLTLEALFQFIKYGISRLFCVLVEALTVL